MYTVVDDKVVQCKKPSCSPLWIRTVRKRVDFRVLRRVPVNTAKARQCVLSVDVHSTRAADSFST